MPTNIRQGDVLLRPVRSIPAQLLELPGSEQEGVVLARGELHGHRHTLPYGGALLYLDAESGSRFLSVAAATTLEQLGLDDKPTGDHDGVAVPAGDYEVIQQSQAGNEQAVARVD